MTKEELIARLKELGNMLNREVSLSGSKEELVLRIAELEEELGDDAIDDGGDNLEAGAGNTATGGEGKSSIDQGNASTLDSQANKSASDDLIAVKTSATLHIEALHAEKNEQVSIALSGTTIRVNSAEAGELIAKGFAVEL
ncbi:TPA: DNA-packaging protein FI [Raoultella terrigena]